MTSPCCKGSFFSYSIGVARLRLIRYKQVDEGSGVTLDPLAGLLTIQQPALKYKRMNEKEILSYVKTKILKWEMCQRDECEKKDAGILCV